MAGSDSSSLWNDAVVIVMVPYSMHVNKTRLMMQMREAGVKCCKLRKVMIISGAVRFALLNRSNDHCGFMEYILYTKRKLHQGDPVHHQTRVSSGLLMSEFQSFHCALM